MGKKIRKDEATFKGRAAARQDKRGGVRLPHGTTLVKPLINEIEGNLEWI